MNYKIYQVVCILRLCISDTQACMYLGYVYLRLCIWDCVSRTCNLNLKYIHIYVYLCIDTFPKNHKDIQNHKETQVTKITSKYKTSRHWSFQIWLEFRHHLHLCHFLPTPPSLPSLPSLPLSPLLPAENRKKRLLWSTLFLY